MVVAESLREGIVALEPFGVLNCADVGARYWD